MKKVLFLFMMLISLQVSAQTHLLKSFEVFGTNEDGKEFVKDVSLVVSIDITNDIVKIDNNYNDVFYLRYLEDEIDDVDNGGYKFSTMYFKAYDDDGVTCTVAISMWKNKDLITVGAIYNNIMYGYRCNILK